MEQKSDFITREQLQQQAAQIKPTTTKRFASALWLADPWGLICEMKQASPSAGTLREDYDPVAIAKSYQTGGATCLSVLTNEFFHGKDEHLQAVRTAVDLPILRKDFIISEYQVYETKVLRADAILLIAACLDDGQLQHLSELGVSLGLDVLLEVHSTDEAERVLTVAKNIAGLSKGTGKGKDQGEIDTEQGAILIGVNNRNLHNFEVDLTAGGKILSHLRKQCDYLLVGESGIKGTQDITNLQQAGAQGFLIGESFLRAPEPGEALKSFITNLL